MTVTQAIDLLDRATAQIEANLAAHNAMRQALAVLREATAPKPATDEKGKGKK